MLSINTMGCTKMLLKSLCTQGQGCLIKQNNYLHCKIWKRYVFKRVILPLFFQQITEGKDLTVTDKKMTRFLMSLTSATELVMHAINNGKMVTYLFIRRNQHIFMIWPKPAF